MAGRSDAPTHPQHPAREAVAEAIEQLDALDPVVQLAQKGARLAVPTGRGFKDALSGTWLGHPLHPPLTDLVVGSWASAAVLDLVGGEEQQAAAQTLIGVGVLAALPTALAGISDWAELRGGQRRVGAVHATGNTVALALYGLSWRARRRGRRGRGVAFATAGGVVATLSAWLGGHLSFARGVGVNQTAFEDLPAEWTAVAGDEDVGEGQLARGSANGVGVLLARRAGELHALLDRCSHRGCSLSEGTLDGGVVTCPCHGSRFRLDGSLVHGPATSPQPALAVRVREGRIEVRAGD
jgi:nitrite reductase/ring-hydroxylating ferredoxin subunit/uncharacterized membrane protein